MHRSSLYLSSADDGAARICSRVWRAGYHAADHHGRDPLEPQHPWRSVWTYSKEQNLPGTEDWCNDQTLEKYVSSHVAQDCADGLNLLIRNYNAGVQITYKLYSEQEIAEDSSRNNGEFYYYPASTPDAKYALVLSGNIFNRTAELKECISTAYQLHQKGYAVFVMRYRAYPDNDNNSPMEDIARAVKYITGHAQQFGVQTESYA